MEVVLDRVVLLRPCLPSVRARRAACAWRALEGAGDPGVAARAVDPASAGRETSVQTARSAVAGGAQPRAAAPLVAGIPGETGDAAALASAARRETLDVPAQASGPTGSRA